MYTVQRAPGQVYNAAENRNEPAYVVIAPDGKQVILCAWTKKTAERIATVTNQVIADLQNRKVKDDTSTTR